MNRKSSAHRLELARSTFEDETDRSEVIALLHVVQKWSSGKTKLWQRVANHTAVDGAEACARSLNLTIDAGKFGPLAPIAIADCLDTVDVACGFGGRGVGVSGGAAAGIRYQDL